MTWGAGPTSPVAVVGIDCRFPGAANKNAFWKMLLRGDHGITEIPPGRWDAKAFYSTEGKPGTMNTTMAGFLDDSASFDHDFFGISPRDAHEMDPQQRLLLQASWRAIEDAAIDPMSLAGSRTSVHVGIMSSEWSLLHMTDYSEITPQRGTGNGYHMAANRISYHLDLKGPSVAVDTACSSSLVAVHLAIAALSSGDCDFAIAAGVNLILTPALSIFYTQAGLSAPDGECKPFSAHADGIGRGEGVGVVVLRRLSDALAHKQPIYAVIEGSAVSHDGRSNGVTAPNRWSQQQVIGNAYARAGVRPSEVHFVEAHGTGTTLGDMIEVQALGAVHAGDREQPCALGSVKGNIGHTEGAAGIAGLIKACLALDRRVLPPSRHSGDENTDLRLDQHGLWLARLPMRLPAEGPVRAAVSSFGLGGTNAHVVLSTPPAVHGQPERGGVGVLTVSADTLKGLQRNLAALAEVIDREPSERLAQICHSTNLVKSSLKHRWALPAWNREKLKADLRAQVGNPRAGSGSATPKVVFLFTGPGAEYPRMTRALYDSLPAYRDRFDEVDAAMRPHFGRSIGSMVIDDMYPDGQSIHDPALAQPAMFAVGYALGSTLRDLGVWPEAMLGHGIGEYAAACLAGVLSLPAACEIVVALATLTRQLPDNGAMVAIEAPADQVKPHVDAEPLVSIAAYNSPRDLVISGDTDAVARITNALRTAGVATKPLHGHALHSPLMRPMVPEFSRLAEGISANPPVVPIASTVHGRLVGNDELNSAYWIEQVTAPVRFDAALSAVRDLAPTHLIEIGPAPVTLDLIRRADPGHDFAGLVPCPGETSTGREVAEVLAELYRDGLTPRWQRLYTKQQQVPCRLPPYVFDDHGSSSKASDHRHANVEGATTGSGTGGS
jgi:acyl transferase domain-containing protein